MSPSWSIELMPIDSGLPGLCARQGYREEASGPSITRRRSRRTDDSQGAGQWRTSELLAAVAAVAAIGAEASSVTVLGIIVLVRTFLSFSLQVELTGRWPWQDRMPGPPAIEATGSMARSSRPTIWFLRLSRQKGATDVIPRCNQASTLWRII